MKRAVFAIHFVLLLLGGLGYVFDFKLFLIVVVALSTVLGGILMHKFYEVFISRGVAKPISNFLFLATGLLFLAGAVLFYFASKDVGISGGALGMAVYCFQSFMLKKKNEG